MRRDLGELEAAIMGLMWSHRDPRTVRDVMEDLRRERSIAYTTVMTVMDKLHTKGLLRRYPVGRAYVYEVTTSKESYCATLMREQLDGGGNQAVTLVHFLERLTAEEQSALSAALAMVSWKDPPA